MCCSQGAPYGWGGPHESSSLEALTNKLHELSSELETPHCRPLGVHGSGCFLGMPSVLPTASSKINGARLRADPRGPGRTFPVTPNAVLLIFTGY